MKTVQAFGILMIIGVVGMGFLIFYPGARSSLVASSDLSQAALMEKGEYLARAGDCMACHTKEGEAPYSGGHGIQSPIGIIAVTNITPDREHGIGQMSLQDFDNALRYGVRQNGDSMFPAMPYPAFSILKDEDVEALYAYFMHGVEPVAKANEAGDIPWYLSMRWPLNGWRLLFAPQPKPFDDRQYADESVARGAYLVQGLGHCGTCHTPRTFTLQERGMSERDGRFYLSGSEYPLDGWIASNLRGDALRGLGNLDVDSLAAFLRDGRNEESAVFGGMAEVINESLQYLSDEDIVAMARYLKTLTPFNPEEAPYQYDETIALALANGDDSMRGGAIYLDNCAACHRTDGMGYGEVFPRLAGNRTLQEANPASAINLILRGHKLEGTRAQPSPFTMPSLAERLSDGEIADVVSFIRTSWGNRGGEIEATEVTPYRQAK